MSQLTYEQFEECFRVLFELQKQTVSVLEKCCDSIVSIQKQTDSKCQALVIITAKHSVLLERLTLYRHRESTKMKTLRNRVAQLTAEKMTLKQQLTEWEKFK